MNACWLATRRLAYERAIRMGIISARLWFWRHLLYSWCVAVFGSRCAGIRAALQHRKSALKLSTASSSSVVKRSSHQHGGTGEKASASSSRKNNGCRFGLIFTARRYRPCAAGNIITWTHAAVIAAALLCWFRFVDTAAVLHGPDATCTICSTGWHAQPL